jgi:hypothetical protein
MPVYAYPDVGRAGLGNMLFPWARAEVFAARYGVPVLAPRWTQPKIGPLLRREKDLRYYTGLFDNSGYIRGLRRAVIIARSARIPGEQAATFMADKARLTGSHIVVFSGWQGWFDSFLDSRSLVVNRLRAILSPRVRRLLEQADQTYEVAVHVRRGDKVPLPFRGPFTGSSGDTMSDQWYINVMRSVREVLGPGTRFRVFSDAKPGQIDSILAEPGVTRSPDNPSIVDILLMSRARVLITSGGSSFSAWASFIGGMPTIWYPGCGLPLIETHPELSIETDLEGRMDEKAVSQLDRGMQTS